MINTPQTVAIEAHLQTGQSAEVPVGAPAESLLERLQKENKRT